MQVVDRQARSAVHLGGDRLVQLPQALTTTTPSTSPPLPLGENSDAQLTRSLHQESLCNGNVEMSLASTSQGDREEMVSGMFSLISRYVAPQRDREEMVPGMFSTIPRYVAPQWDGEEMA